MINLNIIPRDLKKEIKLKILYLSLKNYLLIIFIIICFYSIVLLLSTLFLQYEFTRTINESNLITQNTENYGTKVKNINNEINYINKIQNENADILALLVNISNITRADIKIKQIKFDKINKALTINGFAGSRDNLIAFKNSLESTTFLSDINFPLKNLLEKNNIDFEITAKFKSYEFD